MKLTYQVRLRHDECSGEGKLFVSEYWKEKNALLRADILRDWIGELTELYSDALLDMGKKNATGVQFIELTDDYFQLIRGDQWEAGDEC